MLNIRFGPTSDVSIYIGTDGVYRCCSCRLCVEDSPGTFSTYNCTDPELILKHLYEHEGHGHLVPVAAFEMLKREIKCPACLGDGCVACTSCEKGVE